MIADLICRLHSRVSTPCKHNTRESGEPGNETRRDKCKSLSLLSPGQASVRYRRTHAVIPAMVTDKREKSVRFHTSNGEQNQ